MAKKKNYATNNGSQKKNKKMLITSEQQRKFEKKAERDMRVEQGYDPAYTGGGAHGGTVDAQNRRNRKSSKKDLNRFRNMGTRGLDD